MTSRINLDSGYRMASARLNLLDCGCGCSAFVEWLDFKDVVVVVVMASTMYRAKR